MRKSSRPRLSEEFVDMTVKTQFIKEKVDTMRCQQIKNFFSVKKVLENTLIPSCASQILCPGHLEITSKNSE